MLYCVVICIEEYGNSSISTYKIEVDILRIEELTHTKSNLKAFNKTTASHLVVKEKSQLNLPCTRMH